MELKEAKHILENNGFITEKRNEFEPYYFNSLEEVKDAFGYNSEEFKITSDSYEGRTFYNIYFLNEIIAYVFVDGKRFLVTGLFRPVVKLNPINDAKTNTIKIWNHTETSIFDEPINNYLKQIENVKKQCQKIGPKMKLVIEMNDKLDVIYKKYETERKQIEKEYQKLLGVSNDF